MKAILLVCAIMLSGLTYAQSTINPDTVCLGNTSSVYSITQPASGTIVWTVTAPGILVSGQNTNSIVVDWSLAPVSYITNAITVSLTGTNCPVIPQTLDVEIISPTINIAPVSPLCLTDPCVTLTTVPNIPGTWSGTGVSGNTFCPSISGNGTFNVTFTGLIAGCPVTATIAIIVNGTITLGNITH